MEAETTPIEEEREPETVHQEEIVLLGELRHSLDVAAEENRRLKEELTAQQRENAGTLESLDNLESHMSELEHTLEIANNRIGELSSELKREREKARSAWRLNCEQIASYDSELVEKETEITVLKSSLEAMKS